MKKTTVAAVLVTGTVLAAGIFAKCDVFEEKAIADVRTEDEAEKSEKEDSSSRIDTSAPVLAGSRIAVVSKSVSGEFWDMVHKGMEDAVKDLNTAYGFKSDDQIKMTFEGPGDELNVEEQVNTLDAVIAENPSVLCFSASDMNSCQAQLETATENDIPVIIFDSNVSENELVTGFYGTDNERVGEIAGEKIAEALGEKGSILIFSAQEKTESSQKRVSGFKTAIAEYTDMEVVQEVYADQVEDMSAAMQEALAQNPDTAGVYCTNADVSELYLALEHTEEDQPHMIGVDATTKQQQAVKDGREYGIVSQDPYEMGYQTILAAAKVTDPENREAEGTVFLEPAWIDASNLEDPEYSSYLYKK